MRLAPPVLVLAAALALPACASTSGQSSKEQPSREEWYSGDPSGRMRFDREGPYVALSMIRSFEQFNTSGTGFEADDSDIGIGMRGGLRVEPNLAVELALESVDGYTISSGPIETELDRVDAIVSGKFFFLTDRVQPYVTAGFGYMKAEVDDLDVDDSGLVARMGGGIDLYVTPTVAVFAEITYDRTFGDLDDLDHVDGVIGLLLRF